ncbi:RNA-directed DNA polymerase, eukaryota, reverse transcriptase zinc-binding domain protein [Tanacetum coccineum]
MEALHIAMMEAREKGVFKGVEVGKNKVVISHLQCTDDALLVGEWSDLNITNLIRILRCFQVSSGLKVNLNKSRLLGVGVKNDEVIRVARKEISWVAWSKVGAPLKSRGLGMGSLKGLNLSLLSKWMWRWHTNKDSLWYHILHSIHGSKGGNFLNYASIDTKGLWYDILKACHDVNSLNIPLSSFFTRCIGEGVSIKFWDEEWLDTFKLADVFPRLYALESMKDCNISGVELKSGPDGWSWALKSSGKFSVKSLRVKLDDKILSLSHEKTRWNSLVSKKVNILVWRADKDSLATRCNLDKWSIDLHSVLCPTCEEDVETLDHLMSRENPFHSNHESKYADEEAQHQNQNYRNNRYRRPLDLKADIPVFEGKIQPDEFIDWLNTVEQIFDYQDVLEDVKVKIVAIKLKKHASVWWEQLKLRRSHAFLQLHDFTQQKLSVAEYTEQFDHFMLRCGIVEPEEQTIARYLRGLHKEIYDVLTVQPFISYNDVFKLATRIKKQLKENETQKSTNYGFS